MLHGGEIVRRKDDGEMTRVTQVRSPNNGGDTMSCNVYYQATSVKVTGCDCVVRYALCVVRARQLTTDLYRRPAVSYKVSLAKVGYRVLD